MSFHCSSSPYTVDWSFHLVQVNSRVHSGATSCGGLCTFCSSAVCIASLLAFSPVHNESWDWLAQGGFPGSFVPRNWIDAFLGVFEWDSQVPPL